MLVGRTESGQRLDLTNPPPPNSVAIWGRTPLPCWTLRGRPHILVQQGAFVEGYLAEPSLGRLQGVFAESCLGKELLQGKPEAPPPLDLEPWGRLEGVFAESGLGKGLIQGKPGPSG